MLEYNDQQAEQMIRRAYALAEMNEKESAICMLAEIPQECRRYNDVFDAMIAIHKRLSNRECVDRLNQARIIWAGSKHGKRLQDIVLLLIGIDLRASCYGDVLAFIQQVSREKGKYEDKEWDLLLNRGENPYAVTQLEIETARAAFLNYKFDFHSFGFWYKCLYKQSLICLMCSESGMRV